MQHSKNVAMAFLLGTFLTGGVLGFSANKYMDRDLVCTRKGTNPLVEKLGERLSLDATQKARVDSILDHRSVAYRQAMTPIQAQLDSIKLEAREQMRQVFTQEQKIEFEELIRTMNDTTRKGSDRE